MESFLFLRNANPVVILEGIRSAVRISMFISPFSSFTLHGTLRPYFS